MSNTKRNIKEAIRNNEDFEFYPTTNKMIETVFEDIKKDKIINFYASSNNLISSFSMLDIGAGDGNVLNSIQNLIDNHYIKNENLDDSRIPKITKYGIEKSHTLIEAMSDDIMVLGTNFHQQTLIDKQVDVIFCNPPYSEFKIWMKKILTEANCKIVYMIIPERWEDDKEIEYILAKRIRTFKKNKFTDSYYDKTGKYEVLDETDFLDSEYRQARAKVQIVKFTFDYSNHRKDIEKDPFDLWFENEFKIDAQKNSYSSNYFTREAEQKNKKEEINNSLVNGKNYVEVLEELYHKDMEKLFKTYKALENLDAELLDEMEINLKNVKEKLKIKINGVKNFYWKEFFNNFDKINEKLTSSSRNRMMNKLMNHTSIDFTASNCYAIVIWVLKNANKYIDEQLKEIYLELATRDNIINYKSNKKVFSEDRWRFQDEKKFGKYKLDYRIVISKYNNFYNSANYTYTSYDYTNGLKNTTHDFLNDICTIALNLRFGLNASQITNSKNISWESGKKKEFTYINSDGKSESLMEVKCYKNGNVHIKPNKEFIKKLNIEMGRLMGWVKSPQEASEELDIPINEVNKYYNCNRKLLKNDIELLQLTDKNK